MGLFHAYSDDIVEPKVGEYYEVTGTDGGVTRLDRVTERRALQSLLGRLEAERLERIKASSQAKEAAA